MTSTPWIRLSGTLVQGHQVASGQGPDSPYPDSTIALQRPHFLQRGLDLGGLFPGTLNVSIAPYQFRLIQPEITFSQVAWTDRHPPEDFSFSRCRILVAAKAEAGWVYYPHPATKARHFQTPSVIEVLAPWIPHLAYGDPLDLELNGEAVAVWHPDTREAFPGAASP